MEGVGEVIASTTLQLQKSGTQDVEIRVSIGKPQPFHPERGGDDCLCPYRIEGGGFESFSRVGGVDSFQALELALQMIASDLQRFQKTSGGKLTWYGADTVEFLRFAVAKCEQA
jgi:hypothetical protein